MGWTDIFFPRAKDKAGSEEEWNDAGFPFAGGGNTPKGGGGGPSGMGTYSDPEANRIIDILKSAGFDVSDPNKVQFLMDELNKMKPGWQARDDRVAEFDREQLFGRYREKNKGLEGLFE